MKSRREPGSGRCSIFLSIVAFSVLAFIAFFALSEDSARSPLQTDRSPTQTDRTLRKSDRTQTAHSLELTNPSQQSKFAYVTLLSGIDSSFKYRGFLYNVLIMKRALVQAGSVADLIALIGLSEKDVSPFEADMKLLTDAGIIIHVLPRFLHESHVLGFAEMALLKITPWSFTQYDRLQFLDGDVMPLQNMDCFFKLFTNSFTVGAVSPLNSGWYIAVPDKKAYNYMKEKSIWRLGRDWDKINGWKEKIPDTLMYRGGTQKCKMWFVSCHLNDLPFNTAQIQTAFNIFIEIIFLSIQYHYQLIYVNVSDM